nr:MULTISPECIES: glycosyltransferase family 39 protein [unclassified Thermococcus]
MLLIFSEKVLLWGIQVRTVTLEFILSVIKNLLKPKYALPILTSIAIAIRLIPFRLSYLLGYDTYFHIAYVKYSLKLGEWVNFFPYAKAPWGMLVNNFHPLGLWMTPAYVYRILSIFGISLYDSFRITPVIFGVLTIIFMYLSVWKLYGREEAFLSALFLSISFGHVFRSIAGYYRGDNYLLFWYSLALLGISLALSRRNEGESWKKRRLLLYLVPALASGLASIFWSAYYLIFVFLLGNAIFLSIGALLLQKSRMLVDSVAIVVSTLFGALLANFLGGYFYYGMFGWNRPLGIETAQKLGFHLETIKDAFLLAYIRYAVPLALAFIVLLFIISKVIRSRTHRVGIIVVLLILALVLMVKYYGFIEGTFLSFIKHFSGESITETRQPSLRDVWISYGSVIIAALFFLLRLRPSKIAIEDFVVLGFVLPSIPMIYTWTRFLFIGSPAVAILGGVGLWNLVREIHKLNIRSHPVIAGILIVLVTVPTAWVGVQNTLNVKPFMNAEWEKALIYLSEHSNGNDIVLTWWDQGYWVTYYSWRAPVTQGVPNEFVARYYMGLASEEELMNLGVDYIIVSYDTVLKFPAVLETAGVPVKDYPMVLMGLVGKSEDVFVFATEGYSITARPINGGWEIFVNVAGTIFSPETAFVEVGNDVNKVNITGTTKANAYVYINLNYGYAVLMNNNSFQTTLAKLMFTNKTPGYTLVYSDGGYVKIFRFDHPNVGVSRNGNEIMLSFTNATGTKLILEGFTDNGTRVFFHIYDVAGLEEFTLPAQLNESVVVKYAYKRNGKVLDRGIFRLDDVRMLWHIPNKS